MTDPRPDYAMDVGAQEADTEAHVVARIARENLFVPVGDSGLFLTRGIELTDLRRHLEELQDHPTRNRGTTTLSDTDSFIAFVSHYATDRAVTYLAKSLATGWVARTVFDEHFEKPGWGEHRAQLDLELSPAFRAWFNGSGGLTPQVDFAEFIEDQAPVITDPDAATMLEIAQSLHATSKVEFTSENRLDNGDHNFTWRKTTEGRAGQSGTLEVPDQLSLSMPIFEGSDPVQLTARFRWRITDGNLRIGFKIDRIDDVIAAALDLEHQAIISDLANHHLVVAGYPVPTSER